MNTIIYIILLSTLAIIITLSLIDKFSNKSYENYNRKEKNVKTKSSENINDTFDIITTIDGMDNRARWIYLPIYLKVKKLDNLSEEQNSRINGCDDIQKYLKVIIIGEARRILASYCYDEMISNVSVEKKYREEIRQSIMTEFNKIGYTCNNIDFSKLFDEVNYLKIVNNL